MQTKHAKLTAKPTFLLFEKDKDPARIGPLSKTWPSGECGGANAVSRRKIVMLAGSCGISTER